jgi:rhodanese-related sulfurtransferase
MIGMDSVPTVAVAELPADAVVIDVREDGEWAAGHAPRAQHLPMSLLAGRLDEIPDAEPLFVICRSGGRSAQVVAFLNQRGRTTVNVAGGMQSWAASGLPMVAEHGGAPDVV